MGSELKYLWIALPPFAEQVAMARYLESRWTGAFSGTSRRRKKLIMLLHEARQATIQRAVTRGLDPDVPLKAVGSRLAGGCAPRTGRFKRASRLFAIGSGTTPPTERSGYYGGGESFGSRPLNSAKL